MGNTKFPVYEKIKKKRNRKYRDRTKRIMRVD